MDYDLSDFDKGNYVFKFYYTDRDRNRRYEVSTINDAVPFDVAYQMCQKHIREFEDRYLEWFFECEPTKQYIQTKIDQEVKKVQHDNEILVNTILDTPIGVSKWKKIGEKYGYYEYFRREEVKKIVEEIKEEVLSAKYGTKNRVELLCKLNSYIK